MGVPARSGLTHSPEDHGNAKGIDLDESLQVGRWLCDDGADFIHLSLWDWQSNTRVHTPPAATCRVA